VGAKQVLERLLAAAVAGTPRHGDLNHANQLDRGERGGLAIDPKGLAGDRACDEVIMLLQGLGPARVIIPAVALSLADGEDLAGI